MTKDNKKEEIEIEQEENDTNATETESVSVNVDALTKKISELEEKNTELKDGYLRAYAEMDNVKKRSALESQRKEKYAISSFAKDLLNVADSLERAIASIPEDNKDEVLEGFVSGMKITLDEMYKVFSKNKITEITSIGEKFNPDKHQVIQTIENPEEEDGVIVSEWQKGYMLDDRVLRDSKVVVVKNK